MSREPRSKCSGLTAAWCPNHGRCTCPNREKAMGDPGCPLHAPDSDHAEDPNVHRNQEKLTL
jgi:hypothetical protein